MLMKMMNQIIHSLDCKETIGLNMKVILFKTKNKGKELFILKQENGWEISVKISLMGKEFL